MLFGCYSEDRSETALREQTGPPLTAASSPVPEMFSPLGLSHEALADICHQYSSETAAAILVGLAALVLCCTKLNYRAAHSTTTQSQQFPPADDGSSSVAAQGNISAGFIAALAAVDIDRTLRAWKNLEEREPRERQWFWEMSPRDRVEVIKDLAAVARLAAAVSADLIDFWSAVVNPLTAWLRA